MTLPVYALPQSFFSSFQKVSCGGGAGATVCPIALADAATITKIKLAILLIVIFSS
jgi:hypothetical protein